MDWYLKLNGALKFEIQNSLYICLSQRMHFTMQCIATFVSRVHSGKLSGGAQVPHISSLPFPNYQDSSLFS